MDTTIALVTGATQGIGRETVRRLAELGWTVWLGARDVEAGEKVAAALVAEITGTDAGPTGDDPRAGTDARATGDGPHGGSDARATADGPRGGSDARATGDGPRGGSDARATADGPHHGTGAGTPDDVPRERTTGGATTLPTSPDIRVVQLDVTDDDSVAAAVRTVEAAHGRLDVLVNNAGIGGGWVSPRDATPADFLAVYGVNVLGPVRTTHAFLPLLDRSGQPRVVMVSSGLGSFGVTTDPARFESTLHNVTYPSSKSALNMVASQYAKALDGYQVLIVDPGYTSTAFNGYNGTQTVEQGAEAVVQAATSGPDAPTGTYRDAAGPLPW